MNAASHAQAPAARRFELRFRSLFDQGRALSFPCDADGRVKLDEMSDRARTNYYYARKAVGREFATPDVQPLH